MISSGGPGRSAEKYATSISSAALRDLIVPLNAKGNFERLPQDVGADETRLTRHLADRFGLPWPTAGVIAGLAFPELPR